MNILTQVRQNVVNIPGWQTNKKILVIESDDWGSVSMPSIEVYNELLAEGVPVDKSFFSRFDCLESEKDLNELFNVLSSFKDHRGNHPSITACAVVANPDFKKIKESGMKEYIYEPFTETYKRYPNHTNSFEIWKSGMDAHLLWPQFHGREHLNPIEWLKCINTGNEQEILAFDKMTLLALTKPIVSKRKLGYMAAFDYETLDEMESFELVINEGQDLFERLFGFKSTSFIAPTSIRSDKLDPILKSNGIQYLQSGMQTLPYYEGYKRKQRYWGESNMYSQVYWRRNGKFEPSSNWHFDWIDKTMADISYAYRWGKPAVISSHRVNYIGEIVPQNRDNTLKLLKKLIEKVIEKYPDIIFLSSDQLGEEITRSRIKLN